MLILIKSGRLIDPGNIDGFMDIIVEDGRIADIYETVQNKSGSKRKNKIPASDKKIDKIIDAANKIVAPGFIDMHVHLREPGHEYKETIRTGCAAASHGGFTSVCAMPNTKPVNDSRQITEYILKKAHEAKASRVYPIASISKDLKGESLSEYGELKSAGAIAVSDDGRPVKNSQLMRRALEYAKGTGLLVISHAEDLDLVADGVMNEGEVSTKLGLAGIPNEAESLMVMRDIALCELTGARLHIAHVSTAQSVNAIRYAKNKGLPVTAETAPHYFTLTEESVYRYNTNAKMNPPLRSKEDREAILNGLKDGTIDVIATDHAPHSSLEKDVEFNLAANGIIGLETSIPLSMKLVEDGIITLDVLIQKMSKNPARILGLENDIKVGSVADITIIDPNLNFIIDANSFKSMSRNTPFNGWRVKGRAVLTMVEGEITYMNF